MPPKACHKEFTHPGNSFLGHRQKETLPGARLLRGQVQPWPHQSIYPGAHWGHQTPPRGTLLPPSPMARHCHHSSLGDKDSNVPIPGVWLHSLGTLHCKSHQWVTADLDLGSGGAPAVGSGEVFGGSLLPVSPPGTAVCAADRNRRLIN